MPDLETAAPAAPASTDSGTGFDASSVDSFLSSTDEAKAEAAGTETTESTETADAEPLPGELETETEADVDPEGEQPEFDGEFKPEVVEGADGKPRHQYTELQSKSLQASARFASELQAAIPDITVDDAIAHNEAYTDLSRMAHDMRRGTPDAVARFTSTLLNEAGNGPFVANLATSLLDHLRTANAPAYEQVKSTVEGDIEKEIIGLAKQVANHPDKSIRDGYTQLAKLLYFHFHNGDALDLEKHGAVDPLAQREQQLKAREEAIAQQETQRVQQQQQAWVGAVKNDVAKTLHAEVEKAMEPYKARYAKTPELLTWAIQNVESQARKAVNADKEWAERFNIQWADAHSELSRESAKRVTDLYMARVRGILKTQLPKMLTSASNGAVEQNKARRQQLERASAPSHRVPGATGVPAKQSIAQPPGKFRTPDDYAKHLDRLTTT